MANFDIISRRLLYEEFSKKVLDLIQKERLWGKYLPPERDLQKWFGVSRTTVRNGLALLEKEGLLTAYHGRGTLVAAEPANASGSGVLPVVIVFFTGEPFGGYIANILGGLVSDPLRQISFVNLAVPSARALLFEKLTTNFASGLILLCMADRALVEKILSLWKGPLVLADHYFDGLPVTGVTDDSEGGARQAVEHLLANGHRRIAFVDTARREANPWRYAGYASALRAAGIQVANELVVSCAGTPGDARQAAERLLSLADPPTAIFAFDDLRARGIWQAAKDKGIVVGQDLALVGFGDDAITSGATEELSSVTFDPREIGRQAMATLAELAAGRETPGEHKKIATQLVVRGSSRHATRGT